jgi:hypothetical protein
MHRIHDGPLVGERLCRYIDDLIVNLSSIRKLPCRGNQFTEFSCDNLLCQKKVVEGCRFSSIHLNVELNVAKGQHTKL